MSSTQSLLKKLLQTEKDEQNLLKLLLKTTKKGSGRTRKARGRGRSRKTQSRGSYAKFGPRDSKGQLLPMYSIQTKRKRSRSSNRSPKQQARFGFFGRGAYAKYGPRNAAGKLLKSGEGYQVSEGNLVSDWGQMVEPVIVRKKSGGRLRMQGPRDEKGKLITSKTIKAFQERMGGVGSAVYEAPSAPGPFVPYSSSPVIISTQEVPAMVVTATKKAKILRTKKKK